MEIRVVCGIAGIGRMLRVVEALREAGHDVTIGDAPPQDPLAVELLEHYECKPRIPQPKCRDWELPKPRRGKRRK